MKICAWCLLTNHVHLLVAPDEITGLGRLMKRLAGRQTRYHNRLEGRTGTLWESRYKSSPVDSDTYLLACSRYVEVNPVRARMVSRLHSTAGRVDATGAVTSNANGSIMIRAISRERD